MVKSYMLLSQQIKKGIYSLKTGGEELMIFLDEKKLEKWNLANIGFEILENN